MTIPTHVNQALLTLEEDPSKREIANCIFEKSKPYYFGTSNIAIAQDNRQVLQNCLKGQSKKLLNDLLRGEHIRYIKTFDSYLNEFPSSGDNFNHVSVRNALFDSYWFPVPFPTSALFGFFSGSTIHLYEQFFLRSANILTVFQILKSPRALLFSIIGGVICSSLSLFFNWRAENEIEIIRESFPKKLSTPPSSQSYHQQARG